MTVTYSVCASCAGIDYSRVTSVSYTYSAFYIKPAVFGAGLGLRWPSCWAMLAQMYGYASAIAVTVSVRFCGGRFDSFLGFKYVVMFTLASRVFEYFLRFLLQACVICAFWLRWGSHGVTPLLSCLLSRFPHVRSLYWVFRLLSCWSELQLRWRRSPRRLQRRFFCWPCAVRLCWRFYSKFRDFRASFGSS